MKSIRILAGDLKNRSISFGDQSGVRPPSHYMRCMVFNVLVHRFSVHGVGTEKPLANMSVLDLFAGTGSYGVEALSRGACHVTFVDTNAVMMGRLNDALTRWGQADKVQMIKRSYPCDVPCPVGGFDCIILDPPYDHCHERVTEYMTHATDLLADHGVMVLEYPDLIDTDALTCVVSKTQGKKRVSFLTRST